MTICNVCNENEAAGVASSSLGAISFAYCQVCLDHNAEVYGLVKYTFEDATILGHVADWVLSLSIYKDGVYIRVRDLPTDWWSDD